MHRPPATILHSMTNCAIGSQSFFLQILFLANFKGQMLLAKRRWTRCTLWTRFCEPLTWRKVRKRLSNRSPSSENARKDPKKDANMRSRCSPDHEQEGKDAFFFNFGGRFLNRWCSSSLVLFPSAIYSCQGDLATCFTCLHQSKASQNSARGVAKRRTLAFKHPSSLMSCSMHLHHLHVDLRMHRVCDFFCHFEVRTNATAVVSFVKRILFLLFLERRRNRQSSLRCYLLLRGPPSREA